MCHKRQYFFFFLVVLFQERCFPSVSFTSNSNFSFKIVWLASVHQALLKSEILPQRSLFVGFSRLLVCQIHFNNWWVVRGENVYTGRFPFKMRLYVNDSFFSFFVECCALVYNGVYNIVSVSDISGVNFIASRAVG